MGSSFNKLCCCFGNDDNGMDIIVRYTGEKNCFGQRHGYGTYLLPNGDMYEGCWKYDMMEGYGKYTFANGVIKDGFFKNGEYIGKTATTLDLSTSHNHALPFVQTKQEEQKRQERLKKREERARLREEGKKRRAEFEEKYGRKKQRTYGSTKPS